MAVVVFAYAVAAAPYSSCAPKAKMELAAFVIRIATRIAVVPVHVAECVKVNRCQTPVTVMAVDSASTPAPRSMTKVAATLPPDFSHTENVRGKLFRALTWLI